MKVVVVTLFPELFAPFGVHGVLGRAITAGLVSLETVSPRDFSTDKHQSTDDAPYGGGGGMVMLAAPLVAAIERASGNAGESEPGGASESGREGERASACVTRRVLLTPQGEPFDQSAARRLANVDRLVLVCGRYEGFDERVREFVDEEISLGDFVMTGGEVAALAVLDAVARLQPGVLGNAESPTIESHADGLLEHPHYTRPAVFRGRRVPDVLVSGDHAKIERWRRRQSLLRTRHRRPDLLVRARLDAADLVLLRDVDPDAGREG